MSLSERLDSVRRSQQPPTPQNGHRAAPKGREDPVAAVKARVPRR